MTTMNIFDPKLRDVFKDGIEFLHVGADSQNENNEKLPAESVNLVEESKKLPEQNGLFLQIESNSLKCSHCNVQFNDAAEHRLHYKSDWHRYNIRQAAQSKQTLTLEEFDEKLERLSSTTSSDSESEYETKEILTSHGKVFLKNAKGLIISLHRCLIMHKKDIYKDVNVAQELRKYNDNTQCAVFMLGGGRFSGAIFHSNTPVKHKTYHCYTVRAGQGSAQGACDNRLGASHPKSAGSSLRRYNEQALRQHVTEIVNLWTEDIEKCNVIFYKASGSYNQSVLFGGRKPILDRSDPRVRGIPLSTKKATFSELKRVYGLLMTIHMHESEPETLEWIFSQRLRLTESKHKPSPKNINRSKSREPIQRPDPIQTPLESSSSDSLSDMEVEYISANQAVTFQDSLQEFEDTLTPEQRRRTNVKRKPKANRKARIKEQEEREKRELCSLVSEGTVEQLSKYLFGFSSAVDDEKRSQSLKVVLDSDGSTLLHVAAKYEKLDVIQFLLENGADPCAKNSKQQTPYVCTQNKEVREVFKEFAKANPDKYNYNKANIPIIKPATEEEEERKKAWRKAKREKKKAKDLENKLKTEEESERQRFLKLSDREKMALAAEKRILNQGGKVNVRCFLCAADISGKVPFEYSGNLFCSVECLKAHRYKNPAVMSF